MEYEEVDRLTYKGYMTAQKEIEASQDTNSSGLSSPSASPTNYSDDCMSDASTIFSRASSYICTVKGSANMRSADALTFVCIEHTQKQTFLKTFFSRARRGSAENVFQSSDPKIQAGIEELAGVSDRRSSTPTVRFKDQQSPLDLDGPRRISLNLGMRRNSNRRGSPVNDIQDEISPKGASSPPGTPASSQSFISRLVKPKVHKSTVPPGDTLGIMKDRSVCMIAAEAIPADMDEYRSMGTLRGREEEFGIGSGIRTRVKRQEGPTDKLRERESTGMFDVSRYDPSRGVSAYKKPVGIDLEASVTPDGFLMSRPSPVGSASEVFTDTAARSDYTTISKASNASSIFRTSLFARRRKSPGSSGSGDCDIENCVSEKIVGSVTYAPYESGWGIVSEVNEVELRMLSITPVRGVAGILIDHCISIGHEEKRSAIHVLVNAANKAAHILYVRHGFKRNPSKDRFDVKSNTELKCFTIDLGHPKPPTLIEETPKNIAVNSGIPDTSAPAKQRPQVLYNLGERRYRKKAEIYQNLLSSIAAAAE